jgi:CheY-like chemotaxis protein
MTTGPISIVLADDNNLEHLLFVQILKEMQHVSCKHARDGCELMSMLTEGDRDLPHLVFLNIQMPVKDGMECLSEIRQNETLAALPVIIYSTSEELTQINNTYILGADLYLKKPLDFNELEESVIWIITHYVHKGIPRMNREDFVFYLKK